MLSVSLAWHSKRLCYHSNKRQQYTDNNFNIYKWYSILVTDATKARVSKYYRPPTHLQVRWQGSGSSWVVVVVGKDFPIPSESDFKSGSIAANWSSFFSQKKLPKCMFRNLVWKNKGRWESLSQIIWYAHILNRENMRTGMHWFWKFLFTFF